jgi:hypothetical protein
VNDKVIWRNTKNGADGESYKRARMETDNNKLIKRDKVRGGRHVNIKAACSWILFHQMCFEKKYSMEAEHKATVYVSSHV